MNNIPEIMTLLDYIAIHVAIKLVNQESVNTPGEIAIRAYEVAQMMIKCKVDFND